MEWICLVKSQTSNASTGSKAKLTAHRGWRVNPTQGAATGCTTLDATTRSGQSRAARLAEEKHPPTARTRVEIKEVPPNQTNHHTCARCLSALKPPPPRCGQGYKCKGGPTCDSDHK